MTHHPKDLTKNANLKPISAPPKPAPMGNHTANGVTVKFYIRETTKEEKQYEENEARLDKLQGLPLTEFEDKLADCFDICNDRQIDIHKLREVLTSYGISNNISRITVDKL